MRKYFGVAAVVVFLMALGLALWGGRDIFESPVASIPSILIDRNDNETEIYVHGLNDFRYTNISLRVISDNETFERTREDTYFMFFNSSAENFTINITVWNKNKKYAFNASVLAASPGEDPKVMTLYEDRNDKIYTYTLNNGNLPWKRLMERAR